MKRCRASDQASWGITVEAIGCYAHALRQRDVQLLRRAGQNAFGQFRDTKPLERPNGKPLGYMTSGGPTTKRITVQAFDRGYTNMVMTRSTLYCLSDLSSQYP